MDPRIHTYREVLKLWGEREWVALDRIAQPSWREGIRNAPSEQEAIIKDWMRRKGKKPLPVSRLDPKVALKRLRRSIKAEEAGIPWKTIRGRFQDIQILQICSTPKIRNAQFEGIKISPERMVDVEARVKIRVGVEEKEGEVTMKIRIISEDGTWGFNPASIRMTEKEEALEARP